MPLTDAKIRNAKPADRQYKLTDGGGLHVLVKPTGAKLWQYRFRIADKEGTFSIGAYPEVSLADARAGRDAARALVKQGINPVHQQQTERLATHAENANTFEAVAREWIAKKKPSWTAYYLRQVERFLEADVFPHVGNLPIRNVTAAHLLEILRRVEGRGAETVAMNIRQWSSAIFRYAVATLRADGDPAAALKGAIHRPKTKHAKALSRDQIGQLLRALEAYRGHRTTVIAFRVMLLVFLRTVELRSARWEEINFDRAEWRPVAERMKMRDAHIVPLARQAVALLRQLHPLTGASGFLFPSTRSPNACMATTTLNAALKRMGFSGKDSDIGFSAHGFRATASTILNESGFRPDVIERQLAHAERNKVRASYNHAEYLTERREMMQRWADLIDEIDNARREG